jgi:hypothetical protein
MGSRDCAECHRLSEIFWELSAMLKSAEDELKFTGNRDKTYNSKKTGVLRLRALEKNAYIKSLSHREEHQLIISNLENKLDHRPE